MIVIGKEISGFHGAALQGSGRSRGQSQQVSKYAIIGFWCSSKNSRNDWSAGEIYSKKLSWQNSEQNVFVTNFDRNLWNIHTSIFLNKSFIFYQNSKIRVIWWQKCQFWSKLKNIGSLVALLVDSTNFWGSLDEKLTEKFRFLPLNIWS